MPTRPGRSGAPIADCVVAHDVTSSPESERTQLAPDQDPMTETTTTTPPAPSATTDARYRSVIIRPWPKVVFLWPTLVTALVCWAWQTFFPGEVMMRNPEGDAITVHGPHAGLGFWFTCIFFFNLLVFSFDFSRVKSVAILMGLIALVLTLYNLGWLHIVLDLFNTDKVWMSSAFYGLVSAFLLAVGILVIINTRFNYFEVNHREILHHHGYLGDITRMPTQGLHLNKEIYDLVEFFLLGSGRLVFNTPGRREAIVIDNVMGVNGVERKLKELLSVVAVRVTADDTD
jgi:hypothetical protein